jgi:hypothetical protein
MGKTFVDLENLTKKSSKNNSTKKETQVCEQPSARKVDEESQANIAYGVYVQTSMEESEDSFSLNHHESRLQIQTECTIEARLEAYSCQ